jgi:hypothetical protein
MDSNTDGDQPDDYDTGDWDEPELDDDGFADEGTYDEDGGRYHDPEYYWRRRFLVLAGGLAIVGVIACGVSALL